MTICNGAMEYFALDEMPADEVIDYICLMRSKGKRVEGVPEKKAVKKQVFADQANWY